MSTKFQYTSNQAAGKYGIQAVSEKTYTKYENKSNAGFYMFLITIVGMGAWAASVIISHM